MTDALSLGHTLTLPGLIEQTAKTTSQLFSQFALSGFDQTRPMRWLRGGVMEPGASSQPEPTNQVADTGTLGAETFISTATSTLAPTMDESARVFDRLKEAASQDDADVFAAEAEMIDWDTVGPDELRVVIHMALRLELPAVAMKLAQQGTKRFPDQPQLLQLARVLAPPVLRKMPALPLRGQTASQEWLDMHAEDYRHQWVALRSGVLLGAAPTLKELLIQLGTAYDRTQTLVTRVL